METTTLNHVSSPDIKDLAAALVSTQRDMGKASKSSANPFFKSRYADLNEIIEVSREPLVNNGLALTQMMVVIEGNPYLCTQLSHTSGQWLRGFTPLQVPANKNGDPQVFGSVTTYMRRYALAAFLGIAQEDDDGNSVAAQAANRNAKASPAALGVSGSAPAAIAPAKSAPAKPASPAALQTTPANFPAALSNTPAQPAPSDDAAERQTLLDWFKPIVAKLSSNKDVATAVFPIIQRYTQEAGTTLPELPLPALKALRDELTTKLN